MIWFFFLIFIFPFTYSLIQILFIHDFFSLVYWAFDYIIYGNSSPSTNMSRNHDDARSSWYNQTWNTRSMVCGWNKKKTKKIENGKTKVIKILTFIYLIQDDWNLNARICYPCPGIWPEGLLDLNEKYKFVWRYKRRDQNDEKILFNFMVLTKRYWIKLGFRIINGCFLVSFDN